MSREWKDLQPALCKEIRMTIRNAGFKTMTPVQVKSL